MKPKVSKRGDHWRIEIGSYKNGYCSTQVPDWDEAINIANMVSGKAPYTLMTVMALRAKGKQLDKDFKV